MFHCTSRHNTVYCVDHHRWNILLFLRMYRNSVYNIAVNFELNYQEREDSQVGNTLQ